MEKIDQTSSYKNSLRDKISNFKLFLKAQQYLASGLRV